MTITRLLPLLLFTCLFMACGDSTETKIQDSTEFSDLQSGLQNMIDWSYTVNVDLNQEDLEFEQIALMTNGGCPDTNSAISSNPDIDPAAYKEFVGKLGFRTVSELQTWFVDYGRNFFDLKHDLRPDDVKAFTVQISDLMIKEMKIPSCREKSIKQLNYSAYKKAFKYGTSVGTEGKAQCSGEALYGEHSSINLIVEFMEENSLCNT